MIEGIDASTALVDNELFLRGEKHLYCIAAHWLAFHRQETAYLINLILSQYFVTDYRSLATMLCRNRASRWFRSQLE